ncbi:MAG: DUF308 domain-containing protein [Clostridiales bacterium]|nr:DUF308 domain-containing protein [Clostridiales bacterium]
MKEFLKRVRADVILSGIVCIVLGIVLFVWPNETLDIFCRVFAVGLVMMGIAQIVIYFMDRTLHPFAGILGLIVFLIGLWIFLEPYSVVSLIPIVIGVVLAIHGIQDFQLALEAKAYGYERWGILLLLALISMLFGILCIVNAFGVVKLATQLIGVALVYDGISDLWLVSRVSRSLKAAREEAEALEVEYREVDEEKGQE